MKHAGIAVRPCRTALVALCVPPALTMVIALSGCSEVSNNPHPLGSEKTNTMFVPFFERSPKYLDPTSSYSTDETPFTYQVYEPLYSYHYLKRPYELIGKTAEDIARPRYLDKDGKPLPNDAPGEQIAETVLDIKIKPGILYAPHPAFAKDAKGEYVYHSMKREDIADKHKISDFPATGTRELTADDYVYGIRRLATPRIKSPSFTSMSDYILGLKEYGDKIVEVDKAMRKGMAPTDRDLPFLDFRKYSFAGAEALDKYTLRIRVKGKYPQFKYWLAMTFFSPIPWEAEAFYAQPGMAEREPDDELLAGRHGSVHGDRVRREPAARAGAQPQLSTAKNIHAKASPATRRKATWTIAARRFPSSTRSCSTWRRNASRWMRSSCRATTTRPRSSASTSARR